MKRNSRKTKKLEVLGRKSQNATLCGFFTEEHIQTLVGFDEFSSFPCGFKPCGVVICSLGLFEGFKKPYTNKKLKVAVKLFETEIAPVHNVSFSRSPVIGCFQNRGYDVESAAMQ